MWVGFWELDDGAEVPVTAIEQLVKAWLDEGPRPDVHREAQLKLHREWPVLYGAVVRIVQEAR